MFILRLKFEHARRYLSALLAHFSDDLAFSAPTGH